MKYPILYAQNATDFFSLGLGPLKNTLSAKVIEERNGSFYLEAEILVDSPIFPLVLNDCLIKADAGHLLKDQRFRIKRIVPKHNGTAEIYAEHVSYLAEELTLKPEVTVNGNAGSALTAWKGAIVESNPFVVDSDISTTNSTKWRIDKVTNPRQALGGVEGSILDVWGGEYRFDNYRISLLQKRGTTANTVLAYGRNITDFEQENNIADTYTSIVPYAIYTDDNENEITVTVDGYTVHSQYAGNYPNTRSLPVNFSDEFDHNEVPTKAKLTQLAEQYIIANEVGVPKTSIKVSFLDLSKSPDYAEYQHLEELNLCDDVRVYYPKLGVNTTAKVIRTVWNVLTESYDEIEIGEKRVTLSSKINEQTKQIKEINEQTNYAIVSADGKNMIFYGLYGEDGLGEPTATKVGDSWLKPDGEFTEWYVWDGTVWKFLMSNKENHEIKNTIEAIENEIEVMVEDIDTAVSKANQAVEDAGFATDTANTAHSLATSANQSAQDAVSQSSQAHQLAVQSATDASDALDTATGLLGRMDSAEGTITGVQTSIDDITGELEHKVSQTDFNTLEGTVGTHTGLISANSQQIALKASQSSVDTLTGRVSTAEGQISTQATQIAQRLTASEVNSLVDGKGYATQASVNSQVSRIDGDINSWSSQLQSVNAKVDGMEIGGRNYLLNTSTPIIMVGTGYGQITSNAYHFFDKDNTKEFIRGKEMTFSVDVAKTEGTTGNQIYISIGTTWQVIGRVYLVDIPVGETRRFSFVFTVSDASNRGDVYFQTPRGEGTINGSVTLSNPKLELGNKATDWSPAPEDLATVTALTTNVNQINQTISETNNSIQLLTQTVTKNGQDISSVSADLTVADGKITGLTSKTDGHTTQIGSLQSSFSGLNSTVTTVRQDLDGLEIGGRNLLLNTDFSKETSNTQYWDVTGEIAIESDVRFGRVLRVSPAMLNGIRQARTGYFLEEGEYSWSVWLKADTPTTIGVSFQGSGSSSAQNVDVTTEWKLYNGSKAISTTNRVFRIYVNDGANSPRFYVAYPKLEKGNKATDWTPAPEDMATQSQITQLSSQIDLRVTKADLISQINVQAGKVLIRANDNVLMVSDSTTFISNGTIKTAHIADLAVSGAKIANASISSAKIISLDASKITANTLSAITTNTGALNISGNLTMTTDNTQIIGSYAYTEGVGDAYRPRRFDGSMRLGRRFTAFTGDVWWAEAGNTSKIGYAESFYGLDYYKQRVYNNNNSDRTLQSRIDMYAGVIELSQYWGLPEATSTVITNTRMETPWVIGRELVSTNRINPFNAAWNTFQINEYQTNGIPRLTLSNGDGGFMIENPSNNKASMYVGSDGSPRVWFSRGVYDRTYSSAANMHVTDAGTIGRSTSARKYKTEIQIANEVVNDAKKALQINPVSWLDKAELKRKGHSDRYFGFIADDFHDLGLTEVVLYGDDGQVESLAYDRISMYHNVILRDHEHQLTQLQQSITVNTLNQLEYDSRLMALNAQIQELKQEIMQLKAV